MTAVPAGNALVNTTGNSGLAKGGSGDVLTGIIASLLAQGASPVQAAAGGRMAPRPGGRPGGGAADRLRHDAGGRDRLPAGGHQGGPILNRRFLTVRRWAVRTNDDPVPAAGGLRRHRRRDGRARRRPGMPYRNMAGCVMEAEVSCTQDGGWSGRPPSGATMCRRGRPPWRFSLRRPSQE